MAERKQTTEKRRITLKKREKSLITKRIPQNRGSNKVKEAFEEVEIEMIVFDSEDVITTSTGLIEDWEYEP